MKLFDARTRECYLELFVNAGSRFETGVALGEYDIVYGTGERWLGYTKALEGHPYYPSATFYKLNSKFFFSATRVDETEIRYSGTDIELVDQLNGNLTKSVISAADFALGTRRRSRQ